MAVYKDLIPWKA